MVGVFGPGAIYDNLKDSVLVLGTDYWDPDKFDSISDPYLLSQVKRNSQYFDNLKSFVLVSSPSDESHVPVISFPSWGVCLECNMLQKRQGRGMAHEFNCVSRECKQKSKAGRKNPPKTVPVRFLSVCEKGHIDDFPFYEWIHNRSKRPTECSVSDARLYLEDQETGSPSLGSKVVTCRNCGLAQDMSTSLTKTGMEYVVGKRCTGRRPWLKTYKHERCDLYPMGILKGSSNIYFPVTRSAVTIPPFSDDLSHDIQKEWRAVEVLSQALNDNSKTYLEQMFYGKYTWDAIVEKFRAHTDVRKKDILPDIFELEFAALNSNKPTSEKEFKTNPVPVPTMFREYVDRVVLVEKLRQMITITGFTRINPFDAFEGDTNLAPISSDRPEWLPTAENRGEGIFLSLNQKKLERWETLPSVVCRTKEILGSSTDSRSLSTRERSNARYMLLHTISHALIHSLSDLTGYSISNMQERIYSSKNMAGILIFTSSPSSDGSLGGLVEQGRTDNFYQIMQRAMDRSKSCSSDPLCSFGKPATGTVVNGAACHTCTFLPETACESMNNFLDRAAIHSTLGSKDGFFM